MVQTYRDIFDYQDLHDMVEEYETIAIIGGGFLGSELACALAKYKGCKKKKIIQIFKESGNMGKILPEYLSLWTTKKVEAEGVQVIRNNQVTDAYVSEGKLNLILSSGERVSLIASHYHSGRVRKLSNFRCSFQLLVDHCVVAVGAKPNTELAEESGLEVDKKLGGFLVNTEMEARSNLYIVSIINVYYIRLGKIILGVFYPHKSSFILQPPPCKYFKIVFVRFTHGCRHC